MGPEEDEILKMCPAWLNKEEKSSKSARVGGSIPCAENVRMQIRVFVLQMCLRGRAPS